MFPNHLVITEAASYLNREDATTQDQVHIQSLKELLFCLTGCPNMEKEGYLPFGHISLPPYQVFYASSFSFCSVNLKPFVPGHILVIPRRNVPTLDLLTEEEAADLMLVTRKMIRFIKEYYHVNSVTVAIQDGPPAGQTIPDVTSTLCLESTEISRRTTLCTTCWTRRIFSRTATAISVPVFFFSPTHA